MKYAIVTLSVVLAGLLGVVIASCGTGAGAKSAGPVPGASGATGPAISGSDTSGESLPATTEDGGTTTGSGSVSYQVWFHRGEQLFVVHRTERATPRVGSAAVTALLAGPSSSERSAGVDTQVPGGTKLLGLTIDKGIATVDLTSEYQAGGG